ncbi:hypothetical protein DCM91_01435 [Chitinophaga costaii]|nr:hypothetical protein DCM91_01435 [Chitinophaga costaii]
MIVYFVCRNGIIFDASTSNYSKEAITDRAAAILQNPAWAGVCLSLTRYGTSLLFNFIVVSII